MTEEREVAVLGSGCFWCSEAVYQRVKGVEEVVSGFAGGGHQKANYWSAHQEGSHHAEVVKVTFNPSIVSYEQLLDIFWTIHDPTTPNRQGHDIGPEYRSMILATNDEQLKTAQKSKDAVAPKLWDNPIVTEVKPFDEFFEADESHKDFYNRNKDRVPYCQVIIDPKLIKFQQRFKHLMKED